MSAEERMRVLKMVEDGRLTADEALELLAAIDEATPTATNTVDSNPAPSQDAGENGADSAAPKGPRPTWFCVRVTDIETGKRRVNLKIPLKLVSTGLKIGKRFSPEMEGLNTEEIMQFIQNGERGHMIDVEDNKDGERVEVYLE